MLRPSKKCEIPSSGWLGLDLNNIVDCSFSNCKSPALIPYALYGVSDFQIYSDIQEEAVVTGPGVEDLEKRRLQG